MTADSGTRLFLIRHGETPRQGFCNGHLDVALTLAGVSEMEEVAGRLIEEKIAALYTSDLSRAIHSAEILGRILHLTPIVSSQSGNNGMGSVFFTWLSLMGLGMDAGVGVGRRLLLGF